MKKLAFRFCLASLIATFFISCNKDLDWTPSILAPLITTTANVKDLSDLENKVVTYNLPSIDIGFPNGVNVNVPPLYYDKLGPQVIDISSYFIDVEIDSAVLTTTITNAFPIPIGAGTMVALRSSDDTTNASIIFTYEVLQDIPPGGQYSVPTLFQSNIIPSVMYLSLEDFQSPGGSNVVFTSDPAEFQIEISFLSIKKIRIETDKSLNVSRDMTMNFNTSEEDSTLQNGVIHVTLTNELPINVSMQMYFLDQFEIGAIDSIFDGRVMIDAGQTDNVTGLPISASETKVDIPIDLNKIGNWETSSAVRAVFSVNTNGIPGSFVTASNDLGVSMTISGDLDLQISLE